MRPALFFLPQTPSFSLLFLRILEYVQVSLSQSYLNIKSEKNDKKVAII